MAQLNQMTLQFLESLLNDNPTVELFTSYFFSDIADFNAAPGAPGNGGTVANGGNPTRLQVLQAYQSQVDQNKYLAGVQQPVVYSDPSTASLTGQMNSNLGPNANGATEANTGLPNQTPTNSTSAAGTTEALIPAIANAADDNVPAGVFVAPPNYVQRVRLNTDVK